MPKNESFSSYLKDLKLSKFSDFGPLIKTHNKFLAHELKMRDTSLLWKTYLYEIFLFILHYKYPNNLYLSNISWNERICEIESCFEIVYFFMHPVENKQP